MKTIEDLWQKITDPDFVWTFPLHYVIRRCYQYGDEIIHAGEIPREHPWEIPMGISGKVDIDITGEGIDPITFRNHEVNHRGGQTTLNIPLMVKQGTHIVDDSLVKLRIYKIGVAKEPVLSVIKKSQTFKIPLKLKGELNLVWSDPETGRVLAKQSLHIPGECLEYIVKFPDKAGGVERELPF